MRSYVYTEWGQGGWNPGVKGAGSLREAGEERAGSGIPKMAGTGRKRKKIWQHCVIFCNRKSTKRREQQQEGWERGGGVQGTVRGKREVQIPLYPPLYMYMPLLWVENKGKGLELCLQKYLLTLEVVNFKKHFN